MVAGLAQRRWSVFELISSVGVREARRKQRRNKRGKIHKKELSAWVEPHDWVVENTNLVQISGPGNDNELPTTDNATTHGCTVEKVRDDVIINCH